MVGDMAVEHPVPGVVGYKSNLGTHEIRFGQRVAYQLRWLREILPGWFFGSIDNIDQLVGEVSIEIVGYRIAVSRLAGHIDYHIGAHRRAKRQPSLFGRMRIGRLAVIGQNDRLMAFEAKGDNPGQGGIDNPKPPALASFRRYMIESAAIDCDRVADAAGHAGF